MIDPWNLVTGVFTLVFYLAAFYFLALAGIRYQGKRGFLYIASVVILGPGFLFDLIGEAYENEWAELLSHGVVILAGILFLLSFHLSKKELESGGAPE